MNNILIQTNVEDQYRGRLLSIYFLSFSLQPIGTLIGGAVAEAMGLQQALVLIGCVVAAAMLFLAATSPTVRRL
jgi:zinc transporter ZupT